MNVFSEVSLRPGKNKLSCGCRRVWLLAFGQNMRFLLKSRQKKTKFWYNLSTKWAALECPRVGEWASEQYVRLTIRKCKMSILITLSVWFGFDWWGNASECVYCAHGSSDDANLVRRPVKHVFSFFNGNEQSECVSDGRHRTKNKMREWKIETS